MKNTFTPVNPSTTVEIFKSYSTGRWHWRMRSTANKQIVATPAEGFCSRSNAKRSVVTLLRRLGASVLNYNVVLLD